MSESASAAVRVAIGIIENNSSQVLVSQRKQNVHLPNCWEFPGGKAEVGESFKAALRREFAEELGIQVTVVEKLLAFEYQYAEQLILFQVFKIKKFLGEIKPAENQALQWKSIHELTSLKFPPANYAIINAMTLPPLFMIADYAESQENIFQAIQAQIRAGIRLIQLRAHDLNKNKYIALAKEIYEYCSAHDAKLIVNCELSWCDELQCDGVHLTANRLRQLGMDNNDVQGKYFSASCHNLEEIMLANKIGVHCIFLGAVHETASHPNQQALGWNTFSQLSRHANSPVYALGGMSKEDVATAYAFGAQGIAAIRAFS